MRGRRILTRLIPLLVILTVLTVSMANPAGKFVRAQACDPMNGWEANDAFACILTPGDDISNLGLTLNYRTDLDDVFLGFHELNCSFLNSDLDIFGFTLGQGDAFTVTIDSPSASSSHNDSNFYFNNVNNTGISNSSGRVS